MRRAIALCGGGTKGAYEMGVWKALMELGIDYEIVTGTSIGAINGALMATRDYDKACEIWDTIQMDDVMVDGVNLTTTIEGMYNQREAIRPFLKKFVKNKGADVSPFLEFIDRMIDEEKVRSSDVDYGLVTVMLSSAKARKSDSDYDLMTVLLSSLKALELTKEEIPQGLLKDYIMASSAIFPIFPLHKIGNELYLDGCYYDNLPIDLALKMGADEVIAVDLHTSPSHPNYVNKPYVTYITPSASLGTMMNFDIDVMNGNRQRGYYDAMRVFQKMDGYEYNFYQDDLDQYKEEQRVFVSRVARTESYLTEGSFNKLVKPGDSKRLCGSIEEHIRKKNITYTRQDYFVGAAEICGQVFGIPIGDPWYLSEFIDLLLSRVGNKEVYPDMEIFSGKSSMELAPRLAELKLKKDSAYRVGCIYHAYLAGKIDLTEQLGLLTFLPYELAAALFLLTVD